MFLFYRLLSLFFITVAYPMATNFWLKFQRLHDVFCMLTSDLRCQAFRRSGV